MVEDVHVELVQDLDKYVADMPVVHTRSMETAKLIATRAQAIAPKVTGDYAASIVAQATKGGARVFASDHKSAWIEFGVPSHNEPAHWTLRTAAESLGLKFVKKKG